ncbi:MAG: hypothetical protein V2B19_02650 [Pseudomonadota bacterium]
MGISTKMSTAANLSNASVEIDYDRFYSVEFSVGNVKFLYQFKIWRSPASPIFVLIKNGSEMLNKIKPGDVLKMKYYSTDSTRPVCHLDTEILNIDWNHHGKFKGHYAVNLGVITNPKPATA